MVLGGRVFGVGVLASATSKVATPRGLREIFGASFERVELETVGSMAIFAATNPCT